MHLESENPMRLTLPTCKRFHCCLQVLSRNLFSLGVILSGFLVLNSCPQIQAEKIIAQLVNGQRIDGTRMANWYDEKSTPHLSGKQVFDKNNPFRWMINPEQPIPLTPTSYVEYVGGDRLPCTVLAYDKGRTPGTGIAGPHLVVEPTNSVEHPHLQVNKIVRLRPRWLKRVVWKSAQIRDYKPGTLFLSDGRSIRFRTLRWEEQGVAALLSEGIERFPFSSLAELHFPRQDSWEAYFSQLAILTPNLKSRLIQLQTSDGLHLLTSTERFRAFHHGDRNRPQYWIHIVQPAWSFDPLYVRYGSIRTHLFFHPWEIPLTRIEPTEVEQKSQFGSSWRWQTDQNVQGKELLNSNQEYAWGFGVQAWHKLSFPLHPLVNDLSLKGGLDQMVGTGGCVRAQVLVDSKLFHQTELLVGSGKANQLSKRRLPASPSGNKLRMLSLLVDSMPAGAPPNVDPFDIRDSFNWLEPMLYLDQKKLQEQIQQILPDAIDFLAGWEISPEDRQGLVIENIWDQQTSYDPRFQMLFGTSNDHLTMSRDIQVKEGIAWLSLFLHRASDKEPVVRCSINVDDREGVLYEVPHIRYGSQSRPMMLSVKNFRGKQVRLDVTIQPEDPKARLSWKSTELTSTPPGVVRIFEEELDFGRTLKGNGKSHTIHEDSWSGTASLAVSGEFRGQPRMKDWHYPIREKPLFGEYRFLLFAWKKPVGQMIGMEIARNGEFSKRNFHDVKEPLKFSISLADKRHRRKQKRDDRGREVGYRYDSGSASMSYGKQVLRLNRKPPTEWQYYVRDLYNDFGTFEMTGIGFLNFNQDTSYFDHIYLIRSHEDVNAIPLPFQNQHSYWQSIADRFGVEWTNRPEWYGEVIGKKFPGFCASLFDEGVRVLPEFREKQQVLRTRGYNNKKSGRLAKLVSVPQNKKTTLHLRVGIDPNQKWVIRVRVDGKEILEQDVQKSNTKEGWRDLQVDLSRYAGKRIYLELLHGNVTTAAYWDRIEIQSK